MALLKHHNTLKKYLTRKKMTSKTQTKNYLQILMMMNQHLRHESTPLELWMQVIHKTKDLKVEVAVAVEVEDLEVKVEVEDLEVNQTQITKDLKLEVEDHEVKDF